MTYYKDHNSSQFEYMKPISEDKIDDFIEIDKNLISNENYLEKYFNRMKNKVINIENTAPISYYAPKNKEKEIVAIINKEINDFMSYISYPSNGNKYEPIHIDGIRIFDSFRAKLRLRKSKITKFEDVVDTLKEVLDKFIIFTNLKHTETSVKNKNIDFGNVLSKPEGNSSRESMKKLFNLPSSYSASNPNELFAEVVTYAANNLNSVDKELRTMLFEVLR